MAFSAQEADQFNQRRLKEDWDWCGWMERSMGFTRKDVVFLTVDD